MAYAKTLVALADPTRRLLYERLRRGPRTVSELTRAAHVSQPAVSQHLKVLKEARLVRSRAQGARRYYLARRQGLDDLRRYLESLWNDVLLAYAAGDPAPPSKRRTRA